MPFGHGLPVVRGAWHAAGVTADALLVSQGAACLRRKERGAWVLHSDAWLLHSDSLDGSLDGFYRDGFWCSELPTICARR